MKHYPVHINLRGKKVVIVGGGLIAERKLQKLLHTGAKVTIVSPTITKIIEEHVISKKVEWKKKLFEKDDLYEAFLIIAATDSNQINLEVGKSCTEHQLLNIVDSPENSNFLVPATFNRGKLFITVSTSGASPGFSKKIISEIAEQFDTTYEEYIDFLAESRLVVQNKVGDAADRSHILKQLLEPIFFELTKRGSYQERQKLFEELYQKYI